MKIVPIPMMLVVILLTSCNRTSTVGSGTEDDQFTFAFLTDIHVQPELEAAKGFQKAIDTLNMMDPDFIITGGDLVMDVLNQTHGRADSLYHLYKELSGRFEMPVYNTVGNHEVYGWHRDEPGIEGHPDFGKKMFEKYLGDRYYSFDHKGWHFIILDGIYRGGEGHYIGKIDEDQVIWLTRDLLKLDKEIPIVVSTHMPFITSATQLSRGSMAANGEGGVITNSLEVLQLFKDYNLKLVLQGHLHFLEDIYVGNRVHFITAGAVCGRWWANTPESTPEEGFLLVKVKGEKLDWEYVDYGWTPPE